jgi:prepilin-type N-terminal cleavage/methylation domain-containing protein
MTAATGDANSACDEALAVRRWNVSKASTATVRNSAERGFSLMELMIVVALVGVISAIAVPMMKNTLGDFSLSGDARGVSKAVSLAKLRAAASFSQARVYVDLAGKSYRVETWDKSASAWAPDGGASPLSRDVSFGVGVVAAAPPSTQSVIGQASACVTSAGVAVAETACVLFNSRGIPVEPAGAPPAVGSPTGSDAVYLTDGTAVYGVTLSATGLVRLWRTLPTADPAWQLQ